MAFCRLQDVPRGSWHDARDNNRKTGPQEGNKVERGLYGGRNVT